MYLKNPLLLMTMICISGNTIVHPSTSIAQSNITFQEPVEEYTMLKIGDKAPNFELKDDQGNPQSLSMYKGKKLVLYFYPKDNTPGCTAQACNIRDNYEQLQTAGIHILGISVDDQASHLKFKQKHQLPFPLLIDDEKSMVNGYGVWGEKKFMGKTYMGTSRITFLINENGVIEHIINKVATKDHVQQILDAWEIK